MENDRMAGVGFGRCEIWRESGVMMEGDVKEFALGSIQIKSNMTKKDQCFN